MIALLRTYLRPYARPLAVVLVLLLIGAIGNLYLPTSTARSSTTASPRATPSTSSASAG